jgi:hypothetical protein
LVWYSLKKFTCLIFLLVVVCRGRTALWCAVVCVVHVASLHVAR